MFSLFHFRGIKGLKSMARVKNWQLRAKHCKVNVCVFTLKHEYFPHLLFLLKSECDFYSERENRNPQLLFSADVLFLFIYTIHLQKILSQSPRDFITSFQFWFGFGFFILRSQFLESCDYTNTPYFQCFKSKFLAGIVAKKRLKT